MAEDVLTIETLNERLNLMPQLHDELDEQITTTLQGQDRKDVKNIKTATLILIKLYLNKMIKNQARYGKTSTQDEQIHFIEGEEAYELFYALDSSTHVEELELSEKMILKYDEDIETILDIRGKLTPFINVAIEKYDDFSNDLDLIIEYIFKEDDKILSHLTDSTFRENELNPLINKVIKSLYNNHQFGDFGVIIAEQAE